MIKYNKSTLKKLEAILVSSDYVVRYERGQFKSGYCLLRDRKIIIINKFYDVKGRIESLMDILQQVEVLEEQLDESAKVFLKTIEKTYLEQVT